MIVPSNTSIQNTQRRIEIDILRIVACFLVLFNHTDGYLLYADTDTVLKTWVYMIPTMIARMNVPVFLMLSGALLLPDKQESYSEIIKRRFSRILISLLFFTAVLHIRLLGWTFRGFSVDTYLRSFFTEPTEYGGTAYWFLYCYLGFLLFLPILRKTAKQLTKQDFILLIVVHFFFSTFRPVLNLYLTAHGANGIVFSSNFLDSLSLATVKILFFPLIGYYLDNRVSLERINGKHIRLLVLLAICGIIVSCVCTFYEGTHGDKKFTQHYVALFDYSTASVFFILVKYFCFKHRSIKPGFSAIVQTIASLTFGIYLIDPILRKTIYYSFRSVFRPYTFEFFVSVMWCISSMVVGGLVTFIYRKIRGGIRLLCEYPKAPFVENKLNTDEMRVIELFKIISADKQHEILETLQNMSNQQQCEDSQYHKTESEVQSGTLYREEKNAD